MKNHFIEKRIHQARLYHRNHPAHFDEGVHIRYDYSNFAPDEPTFWDDAVFIVNDYRVALWWKHPRYVYSCLIHAQAVQRLEHICPFKDPSSSSTLRSTKSSRTEISKGVLEIPREAREEYFDRLRLAERQVGEEVPFRVVPSLTIKWYEWCKGMDLCAPYEVRSETDLKQLVAIARRLIKRQSTLLMEFGDPVYTQQDWLHDRAKLDAIQANQKST